MVMTGSTVARVRWRGMMIEAGRIIGAEGCRVTVIIGHGNERGDWERIVKSK